jgi:hypothetical protein
MHVLLVAGLVIAALKSLIMLRHVRSVFPIILLALCACSPKPPTKETAKDAPPAAPPRFDFGSIEMSPASGSGREATFRVAFKSGSQKPALVGLLINTIRDGKQTVRSAAGRNGLER